MFKKIAAAALVSAMLMANSAQAAGMSGSPSDVGRVLSSNGITSTSKVEGNKPYLAAVMKDGTKFVVEFYRCDASKTNCGIAIWTANWSEVVSKDQLNRWNRWTFVCPIYAMDEDKSTSVWMGITTDASDNAKSVELQMNTFTKCLDQFQDFLRDPEGFLKENE